MIINDCVLDLENSVDLEPGAGTWLDQSRYRNNGTITAGTGGWTQRPNGLWVMDFDGAATFVEIADAPELSFGNGTQDYPFSLAVWANVTNITTHKYFFSKDNNAGAAREYALQWMSTGTFRVRIYDQNAAAQTVRVLNVNPSLLEWHFIAATYDGRGGATAGDGITIYLDGIESASTATNNGAYVAMQPSATALRLGTDTDAITFFAGSMGFPRIFSYALTAGQIRNRYEAEKHLFGVHD